MRFNLKRSELLLFFDTEGTPVCTFSYIVCRIFVFEWNSGPIYPNLLQ